MPERRHNDAQVDRLLAALKSDLSYRQKIARKIADKEKIKYNSAMRRLQRYITEAGERRSFARAPVEQRRVVRQIARREPLPETVGRWDQQTRRIEIPERPIIDRRPDPADYQPRFEPEPESTSLYELRAIVAYFDGDTREAGRALKVDYRLLELAAGGTTITRRMGGGKIDEGVERLYRRLSAEDEQDIQDFSDLLYNMPDWEIGVILDDLADGDTTFADWMDVWRDSGMDYDELKDDGAYWALWRAAYAKAKA